VGKAILDECLLNGPLANRTRILVTHALHVLDKTDYIYVMDNGVITEEGTYQVALIFSTPAFLTRLSQALIKESVVFAKLMEEYGRLEQQTDHGILRNRQAKVAAGSSGRKTGDATLMQAEERNTGAVPWSLYKKYLSFAGGIAWAPIIVGLLLLNEAARGLWRSLSTSLNLYFSLAVGNNLFLGLWTSSAIRGFSQGEYMAVYAGLGGVTTYNLYRIHNSLL